VEWRRGDLQHRCVTEPLELSAPVCFRGAGGGRVALEWVRLETSQCVTNMGEDREIPLLALSCHSKDWGGETVDGCHC
jgi:hypothetical protein